MGRRGGEELKRRQGGEWGEGGDGGEGGIWGEGVRG